MSPVGMAEVAYEPKVPPMFIGRTQPNDGSKGYDYYIYGLYKIVLGDFHALIPHQAASGTVSMDPLNVDDPEQRGILIEEAERMRKDLGAQGA